MVDLSDVVHQLKALRMDLGRLRSDVRDVVAAVDDLNLRMKQMVDLLKESESPVLR